MTQEWQPWHDWWRILIVILVGLWLLPSCASKSQLEATRLYGQCWSWNRIEKESVGHLLCFKQARNRAGKMWICTRKRGHRGKCHHHSMSDQCLWQW